MLTLPLRTRLLLSSQNYSLFLSWMTKGKSLRGRLIITRKASNLILILILRSLWRRRWRSNKAIKASPSLCNTTNTGVYLIQLNSKSIKMSIYALKLHHDYLKSHTTEEEGAELEEMVGVGGSIISVVGCFGWSWASLCRTNAALMAPMTV